MTIFWVDDTGRCVGATDDKQKLDDLTPITEPPESGLQKWDGNKWTDTPELLTRRKQIKVDEGNRRTAELLLKLGIIKEADLDLL